MASAGRPWVLVRIRQPDQVRPGSGVSTTGYYRRFVKRVFDDCSPDDEIAPKECEI